MDIFQVIANLNRKRSDAKREIEDIVKRGEASHRTTMTAEEQRRTADLFTEISKIEGQIEMAKQVRDEDMATDAAMRVTHPTDAALSRGAGRTASFRVTREERIYNPGNDPKGINFLRDVARSQVMGDAGAWERLARHSHEEQVERAGIYTERVAGDLISSGAGGIVVPQYLVDMTAPAVAARRPYADAMTRHQLPPDGMSFIVPMVTTATSAALQTTELTAVSATSLAETDLTVAVRTAAGQQTVSRQAIDRSRIDEFVMGDLMARVATCLDNDLINGAVTGLDAVAVGAAASATTMDKVYPAILGRQAASEAILLSGAVDLVVMHSRRWANMSASLVSSWPFVSDQGKGPGEAGKIQAHGYGSNIRGVLPNGLLVVVDNNIATNKGAGTNEDVIYVVPSYEAHLWEDPGQPVMIRAEQPNAAKLGVLFVAFSYYAFTHSRYANAMGKVTGLTPPTF